MNIPNFANPLETVQIISIVSYLNTLSDFLYSANLLKESDQYKKIPVVNALYNFSVKNEANPDEKMFLVRKLLEGSDLYGEKENEAVDANFVNVMFNHIISSFVFEEYGNVYGFLAEMVRTSKKVNIDFLVSDIRSTLEKLTFENEYGKDSILSGLAVESIMTDLILPLFPSTSNGLSIISVDFMFAQAGFMLLRSVLAKFGHLPQSSIPHLTFIDPKTIFREYLGLGHLILNLVDTQKVDGLTMSAFFLPALLHYVYLEKDDLQSESIRKIITDQGHWKKAYELLFFFLQHTFADLVETLDDEGRYKFHLALSKLKNHTVLAREKFCSNASDEKVFEYVTDYGCRMSDANDRNQVYQNELSSVLTIYFQNERETIRNAFDQSLIHSLRKGKIIIFRGSFMYEVIKPSADFLVFYYPDDRRSVHFALVRTDNKVTLIRENDNPSLFREKLGVSVSELFAEYNSTAVLQDYDEDFERFLSNIAMDRTVKLEAKMKSFASWSLKDDWWEKSGFSLKPFHSRLPSSITGDTAISREFIRILVEIESRNAGREVGKMQPMLENRMFQNLEHALMRLEDAGFKQDCIIDVEGLTALKEFAIAVNVEARLEFISVVPILERAQKLMTSSRVELDEKFNECRVYVESTNNSRDSGYGYKFVYIRNGGIAEIRDVREFKNEVLVVYDQVMIVKNGKIYKEVDQKTLVVKEGDLLVEKDGLLVRFPELIPSEIRLSLYNQDKCDKKNGEAEEMFCLRTPALVEYFSRLESARKYVLSFGKFTDQEIRNILKYFYFPPGGKTVTDFALDWMVTYNKFLPSWCAEFEISEPGLFHDLMFKSSLDSKRITVEQAVERIDFLYSERDLDRIGTPVNYMRFNYLKQKAYHSVKFEDYFALGYLQGTIGSRLGENTDEARRMRNALYRLAIRQNFDPIEEFPQKLYRGERRPREILDKLFVLGKDFSFGRFTPASRNEPTAKDFALKGKMGDAIVIYEINFSGQYLRAKVENVYYTVKEESYLLPQNQFLIRNVTEERNDRIGDHLRVVLSHKPKNHLKEVKNALRELKILNYSDTIFYQDEGTKKSLSKIQLLKSSPAESDQ